MRGHFRSTGRFQTSSRMLKKTASVVLASFRPSTYPQRVRLRAVTRCGLAGQSFRASCENRILLRSAPVILGGCIISRRIVMKNAGRQDAEKGGGVAGTTPVLAATHGLRRIGEERPGALLARRARNKNVLDRCAQYRATLADPQRDVERTGRPSLGIKRVLAH